MKQGRGVPAPARLLPTHTRIVKVEGVEVEITVASTRSGLAFYPRGTGPFVDNRAARRRRRYRKQ